MTTNADVEWEIARRIEADLRKLGILRKGHQCEVHLHRGNRKKRRDADFGGNWDPDSDSIRIAFSPMEEDVEDLTGEAEPSSAASKPKSGEDRLGDLIRALDRAENRPGYEFVSLKWFRDSALAVEGFAWAAEEIARHDILREAIDRDLILTKKVPNPRPPNFPVTAVRLNRSKPEVSTALGVQGGRLPEFRPIRIRGESLSTTVLNDRR